MSSFPLLAGIWSDLGLHGRVQAVRSAVKIAKGSLSLPQAFQQGPHNEALRFLVFLVSDIFILTGYSYISSSVGQ